MKKTIVMAGVLLFLQVIFSGCSSSSGADKWAQRYGFEKGEVYPIEIGAYGFPFIETRINDEKINMMFDTGNMVGIQISSQMADKLNLSKIDEWQSKDAGGNIKGAYSIFAGDQISVFNETMKNQRLFQYSGNEFGGVLTPLVLLDKRFTIDYKNKFIGVSKSSFPESDFQSTTLQLITNSEYTHMNAMPLVYGTVNGKEVLVQLDTGKSRTVVDGMLVKELGLKSGERGCIIDSVKLGSFEFSIPNAKEDSFAGISQGYPGPIMLGLGSDIISQFVFTVDYPGEIVIISK